MAKERKPPAKPVPSRHLVELECPTCGMIFTFNLAKVVPAFKLDAGDSFVLECLACHTEWEVTSTILEVLKHLP